MLKKCEIQMRDPFVVPVLSAKEYFLYGTTDKNCWTGPFTGFDVYRSRDLEDWEGPFPAFRPEANFWADRNFWAPEVFAYQGRYYMFASFKAENVCRGTQVLAASSPLGPFLPHSDGPVTPREWECLDGTFYVDDQGQPWIIFCHEWVQAIDGEIHALKLARDLRSAVGQPVLLFTASQAPWAAPRRREFFGEEKVAYVTDGPFLYRPKSGGLIMLWSSIGKDGYAMGVAQSPSGKILGPWKQEHRPIYGKDGGHGMLFTTFEGQLLMTIHTPNKTPCERPVFIEVEEQEGSLRVKNKNCQDE